MVSNKLMKNKRILISMIWDMEMSIFKMASQGMKMKST